MEFIDQGVDARSMKVKKKTQTLLNLPNRGMFAVAQKVCFDQVTLL